MSISAALRIDLKVIQTELTPLSRQHVIRRRAVQRNVPEKYEYAAGSAQVLNAALTVSAQGSTSDCVDWLSMLSG